MDLTDLYNKGLLTQDENVAYQTTQRRIKNIIHPISIIVTDKQIIICTPKIGGAKVSTFGYGRVQNIKVRKKFFSSSIEVHTMTDKVDVAVYRKTQDQRSFVLYDQLKPLKILFTCVNKQLIEPLIGIGYTSDSISTGQLAIPIVYQWLSEHSSTYCKANNTLGSSRRLSAICELALSSLPDPK